MMKCDSTRLSAAATPALTLLLLFAFVFHLPQAHQIVGEGSLGPLATDDCSMENLEVHQGQSAPLPSGIPTYTVTVLNLCSGGCSLGNIHLSCGAFSSARLIDPSIFRRLSINDCLLNGGRPLAPGAVVSFQYANSFSYPLAISTATCMR